MKKIYMLLLVLPVIFLSGCAAIPDDAVLGDSVQQLKLRSIQSRTYETTDKKMVMRSIIATLQDLEFLIEASDIGTGTISARKFNIRTFAQHDNLKMTVSVQLKGSSRIVVRANAEYNNNLVDDPVAYQNFFNALSKSLYLSGKVTN